MKKILSGIIVSITIIVLQNCVSSTGQPKPANNTGQPAEQYVCLPCGSSCDTIIATTPGTCMHCNMQLVKKTSIVHGTVAPPDLYAHILKAGSSNILLLDVRTAEEFSGTAPDKFGRLKNAINIPVQQLQTRIKELATYKDKEIIVYCSHSHRSPQASYLLTQNGFKKVTNLQQGMYMWKVTVKDKESNDSLYIAQ
jgi:rhodanese-related sulfurtransferase/DNA-directed RNA polymerase subunit RPC12/RpoP